MTDDAPTQLERDIVDVIEALETQAQRLDFHKLPVPTSTLAPWLRLQAARLARAVGIPE